MSQFTHNKVGEWEFYLIRMTGFVGGTPRFAFADVTSCFEAFGENTMWCTGADWQADADTDTSALLADPDASKGDLKEETMRQECCRQLLRKAGLL